MKKDLFDKALEAYAQSLKEEQQKQVQALFGQQPRHITFDAAHQEGDKTVHSRFAYGYSTHTEIVPLASATTITLKPGKGYTSQARVTPRNSGTDKRA